MNNWLKKTAAITALALVLSPTVVPTTVSAINFAQESVSNTDSSETTEQTTTDTTATDDATSGATPETGLANPGDEVTETPIEEEVVETTEMTEAEVEDLKYDQVIPEAGTVSANGYVFSEEDVAVQTDATMDEGLVLLIDNGQLTFDTDDDAFLTERYLSLASSSDLAFESEIEANKNGYFYVENGDISTNEMYLYFMVAQNALDAYEQTGDEAYLTTTYQFFKEDVEYDSRIATEYENTLFTSEQAVDVSDITLVYGDYMFTFDETQKLSFASSYHAYVANDDMLIEYDMVQSEVEVPTQNGTTYISEGGYDTGYNTTVGGASHNVIAGNMAVYGQESNMANWFGVYCTNVNTQLDVGAFYDHSSESSQGFSAAEWGTINALGEVTPENWNTTESNTDRDRVAATQAMIWEVTNGTSTTIAQAETAAINHSNVPTATIQSVANEAESYQASHGSESTNDMSMSEPGTQPLVAPTKKSPPWTDPAGNLTVYKNINTNSVDNMPAYTCDQFSVKITGPEFPSGHTKKMSKSTNSNYECQATWTDIASGSYTVTETVNGNSSMYIVDSSDTANVTGGTTVYADVTNGVGTTDLTINKTIDEDGSAVPVKGNLVTYDEVKIKVTGPNGYNKTQTLNSSWSTKFEDLADGTYTVTEIYTDKQTGYSYTNTQGAWTFTTNSTTANKALSHTFNNNAYVADLKVEKHINNGSSVPTSGLVKPSEIQICVKSVASGDLTANEYNKCQTLGSDWTTTFTGMPVGTYTVSEVYTPSEDVPGNANNDMMTEGDTATVTVVPGDDNKVILDEGDLTNTIYEGDLTVEKHITNNSAIATSGLVQPSEIQICVKSIESGALDANEYNKCQALNSSWQTTFTGMPVGDYVVSEVYTPASGVKVMSDGKTATVHIDQNDHQKIVLDEGDLTNEIYYSDLTVKKAFDNESAMDEADISDPSEITICVNSLAYGALSAGEYSECQTLDNNWETTFTNLPVGKYEVTEYHTPNGSEAIMDDSATTTVTVAPGLDTQLEVTLTNEIYEGDLTVQKFIDNNSAIGTDDLVTPGEIQICVNSVASDINPSLEDGEYSVCQVLDSEWKTTFYGLPVGTYEVTEIYTPANSDDVPVMDDIATKTVVIEAGDNDTVILGEGDLTNTIYTADLTVTKDFVNDSALATEDLVSPSEMTICVDSLAYGALDAGEYSECHALDENWQTTFNDLPAGQYEVTEFHTPTGSEPIMNDDATQVITVVPGYDEQIYITLTNEIYEADLTVEKFVDNTSAITTDGLVTPEEIQICVRSIDSDMNLNLAEDEYKECQVLDENWQTTFVGLPVGAYEVSEIYTPANADGVEVINADATQVVYVDQFDNNTVIMNEGDLTNPVYTSDLTVVKDFINDSALDENQIAAPEEVTICVNSLAYGALDAGEYSECQTLDENWETTFSDLPVGKYEVTEYHTPNGSEPIMSDDATQIVTVTPGYDTQIEITLVNEIYEADLTVEKFITNDSVLPTDQLVNPTEIEICVNSIESDVNPSLEAGEYSVCQRLGTDWTTTFVGMPVGTYEVSEIYHARNVDNPIMDDDHTVVIDVLAEDNNTVILGESDITNTIKTGSITINKQFINDPADWDNYDDAWHKNLTQEQIDSLADFTTAVDGDNIEITITSDYLTNGFNYTDTQVLGDDYTVTWTNLPYGTYTVTETLNADNTQIITGTTTVVIDDNENNPVNNDITNEIEWDALGIYKVDADTGGVIGGGVGGDSDKTATFAIYDYNTATGEYGGAYDPLTGTYGPGCTDDTAIGVEGSDNSCTPVPLDIVQTDKYGYAQTRPIPVDADGHREVIVKELDAPDGYHINNGGYVYTLTGLDINDDIDNIDPVIVFEYADVEKEGIQVEIQKQVQTSDGTVVADGTESSQYLSGFEFTIYNDLEMDVDNYGDITTGYASSELDPATGRDQVLTTNDMGYTQSDIIEANYSNSDVNGDGVDDPNTNPVNTDYEYCIVETDMPDDFTYKTAEPQCFVSSMDGVVYHFTFINIIDSFNILIEKKDENGKAVEGVTFAIYDNAVQDNKTGEWVVNDEDLVATYTTGVDGTVMTEDYVANGNYYIQEIAVPMGEGNMPMYEIDDTVYEIDTSNITGDEYVYTHQVVNEHLKVKIDGYDWATTTYDSLSNATFELVAYVDGVRLMNRQLTDEIGEVHSGELPIYNADGTYVSYELRQSDAPDAYYLNPITAKFHFEVVDEPLIGANMDNDDYDIILVFDETNALYEAGDSIKHSYIDEDDYYHFYFEIQNERIMVDTSLVTAEENDVENYTAYMNAEGDEDGNPMDISTVDEVGNPIMGEDPATGFGETSNPLEDGMDPAPPVIGPNGEFTTIDDAANQASHITEEEHSFEGVTYEISAPIAPYRLNEMGYTLNAEGAIVPIDENNPAISVITAPLPTDVENPMQDPEDNASVNPLIYEEETTVENPIYEEDVEAEQGNVINGAIEVPEGATPVFTYNAGYTQTIEEYTQGWYMFVGHDDAIINAGGIEYHLNDDYAMIIAVPTEFEFSVTQGSVDVYPYDHEYDSFLYPRVTYETTSNDLGVSQILLPIYDLMGESIVYTVKQTDCPEGYILAEEQMDITYALEADMELAHMHPNASDKEENFNYANGREDYLGTMVTPDESSNQDYIDEAFFADAEVVQTTYGKTIEVTDSYNNIGVNYGNYNINHVEKWTLGKFVVNLAVDKTIDTSNLTNSDISSYLIDSELEYVEVTSEEIAKLEAVPYSALQNYSTNKAYDAEYVAEEVTATNEEAVENQGNDVLSSEEAFNFDQTDVLYTFSDGETVTVPEGNPTNGVYFITGNVTVTAELDDTVSYNSPHEGMYMMLQPGTTLTFEGDGKIYATVDNTIDPGSEKAYTNTLVNDFPLVVVDNTYIEGANIEFRVWNEEDSAAYYYDETLLTTNDGRVIFKDMPVMNENGEAITYYIQEVGTPNGIEADPNIYSFTFGFDEAGNVMVIPGATQTIDTENNTIGEPTVVEGEITSGIPVSDGNNTTEITPVNYTSIEVCATNPDVIATSPDCPELCPSNPDIFIDDPACGVCPSDKDLAINDPACGVCKANPELSADDPSCGRLSETGQKVGIVLVIALVVIGGVIVIVLIKTRGSNIQ